MIRKLDRLWFRLLSALYRWVLRGLKAHYWREQRRRFQQHMAWQRAHLN